jgi:hypothetical protein
MLFLILFLIPGNSRFETLTVWIFNRGNKKNYSHICKQDALYMHGYHAPGSTFRTPLLQQQLNSEREL